MKLKRLAIALLALIAFSASAYAADVAITSIGQGPDAMMVRVLLRRLKLSNEFDALMKPEKIADQKVLVAVVGGSSKGLGAAGIDKEQEVERTKALCDAAVAKGMKILIMHVGGEGRRGTLSDLFINAAAPYGDAMIIVDGGNNDGIFTKFAEAKKIEMLKAPNVKGCEGPLGAILSGWLK